MRLRQPIWPRFLPTDAVLSLATLGPVGRRLPAPGTWGSLAGILYFVVVFLRMENAPVLMLITLLWAGAVGAYFAVAICGEAEFRLAKKDPGEVILDEFVAMPLVYLGWPSLAGFLPGGPHWSGAETVLLGFALFRLYDILKPLGIRRLQDLPGGWGIVADDTAAALAACATLHLIRLASRHWA